MITLVIPSQDVFDNAKMEFLKIEKPQRIVLEHSLISLSKWESKWKKPYISLRGEPHTREESLDYIRCMTVNSGVDPLAYMAIPNRMIDAVNKYIDDPRTATTFQDWRTKQQGKQKPLPKVITSEYIYAQMVKYGIPFNPCEKWHLNRLLTLIKACAIENGQNEMMSKKDLYAYHRAVNARNRKPHGRH